MIAYNITCFHLSTVKSDFFGMIFCEVYRLFMEILPLALFKHWISAHDDGDFRGWISQKWD